MFLQTSSIYSICFKKKYRHCLSLMSCRSAFAGSSVPCSLVWAFCYRYPYSNKSRLLLCDWLFLHSRGTCPSICVWFKLLANHNSECRIIQTNPYRGGGILWIRVGSVNLRWAEETRVSHDPYYFILASLNIIIFLKFTMAGSRLEKVGTVFTRYVCGSERFMYGTLGGQFALFVAV